MESQNAASAQEQAAQQATQAQLAIYRQNQQNLSPWIQGGGVAQDTLMRAIPTLIQPFMPTEAQLAATPGYQFALSQGLRAAQNQETASGLGQSSPAMVAAAQYATGLADQTFNERFNQYWGQNQNIYNMLAGPANQGESAASALAGVGAQTGANVGSNIIGAGNAQAGSDIAGANAISGGINSGIGNYMQASLYSQLMGQGGQGQGWSPSGAVQLPSNYGNPGYTSNP
jgi:hypothetical protein